MPGKQWDDEESSSSGSEEESGPQLAIRRGKFDDEEAGDSDVVDSWDAEDSEVEREKAKKAAEAKAKAEAEAAAKKKSKTTRIQEHQAERARRRAEAEEGETSEEEEEETEAQKRLRQKRAEKEADLKHAEDLFGGVDAARSMDGRKAATPATVIPIDPSDPTKTLDLATLPLFNPVTKAQFERTREALVAMLSGNTKKPHYVLFLQEFTKQLAKDLPSDQIKKISSSLTTLSNEKMREEKAADKGGKKSKAQKTKTTLAVGRPNVADTSTYEETFGDDDFM